MCGIAGCWSPADPAAASPALITAMTDRLRHRGPDGSGVWCDPAVGIALGHRRLSIVDLSPLGAQPMASPSGRYQIVFNGQIYNYRALRDVLAATGATFRGHSDTEVLLAGIERWGLERTLHRAHGMFAMACWDVERRALTLARDRTGEKPLYWVVQGGRLAFASELKALAALPWLRLEPSADAVAAFLRFSYVPTPHAVFRGVGKLEPGTWRTFTDLAGEPAGAAGTFWSAAAVARAGLDDPLPGDESAALDVLDGVLRTVIGEQMVADVPLGAFLSGGVDSSLVVALMQAQSSRPVRTFTIGFREARYDEAAAAAAVARHLGTDHTAMVVSPEECLAVIPHLATMYDEPFGDSSQVPTHLVAALARRHVTVSLSGDGGDEVFGGYTRYLWTERLWHRVGGWPAIARRAAARAVLTVPTEAWDGVAAMARPALPPRLRVAQAGDKLHKAVALLRADSLDGVYDRLISNWFDGPGAVRGTTRAVAAWPDWVQPADAPSPPLPRMQYRDLVGYLPDDILVKVDRATMAVSLESRAPFLDARVIELAWRLPVGRRVVNGQGKWALRRLLDRYVPRTLIERPKQGFAIPVAEWLRGPLRDWADDLLGAASLARDPFLDPAPVQALWRAHRSGARNHQASLWNVLMYVAWRDAWHDASRGAPR
ncbi:MAG: asparagine synthase (glutamine-hydrolyzing) [Gemmatimonadota bacterium]